MIFTNREQAGQLLAKKLARYKKEKPVILALPRGGVPVGFEVAKKMGAPLDVVISRKLGAPGQEELGIGAISEDGVRVLDENLITSLGISFDQIEEITAREKEELGRRVQIYRQGKTLNLKNKTIILVDDGLATGVTAKAAIEYLKGQNPAKIILALPVCSADSLGNIQHLVDKIVCLYTPENLQAVGQWYENFEPVTDENVVGLLNESK